jgi:hypothetical protein
MRAARARLTAMVAALAAIALILGGVHAQEGFRVVYNIDRSNPEQIQVAGTVFNDSGQDVFDVSITAEALDAKGKIVARGITYVSARIPGRGSAAFVCKVPVVPAAVRYRAAVSGFRLGAGPQSP